MDNSIYTNVNKIIERDSKTSTYKFALLRGVIEIIQDNSPYINVSGDKVTMPIGLLVEKWLLYYYPIIDCSEDIPQINGNTNLAFAKQMKWLTEYYKGKGEFSAFYNDLRNKGIPHEIEPSFFELLKKLRDTIVKMPMRYIGRSVSQDYYSIFNYEQGNPLRNESGIDIQFLVERFGVFSIPSEYYQVFKLLGSFIVGQDSILFKWAEFSVNASGQKLSIEKVINEVLKSPITEREVNASKSIYQSVLNTKGDIHCVWSGDLIKSYDIDHVIPFSVWKNNDLWNLLPAKAIVNNKKRDKIPAPSLVQNQKDLIVFYWELIREHHRERFEKEVQVSLLGNNPFSNWQNLAFDKLKESCTYLISTRGYEAWSM